MAATADDLFDQPTFNRLIARILDGEVEDSDGILDDIDFRKLFLRGKVEPVRILAVLSEDYKIPAIESEEAEERFPVLLKTRERWGLVAKIESLADLFVSLHQGNNVDFSTDEMQRVISEMSFVEFKSTPSGGVVTANPIGKAFPKVLEQKTNTFYMFKNGHYRFVCERLDKSVEVLHEVKTPLSEVDFVFK
jgi:hypothetical protein